VPRELKDKQLWSAPPFFQSADEKIYSFGGQNFKKQCGRAEQNKKRQVGWKRRARRTTGRLPMGGSCGVSQKMPVAGGNLLI